jgi:hypothetical protein
MEEDEIKRYYGDMWRKSALIEGAYEAEEFFPHIGEKGRWLFFTATPIKESLLKLNQFIVDRSY